ncbi:ERF017 protein [Hibiscus syriacus]|uniref:ERF017 protein n=1 Tax=Hibiscus syriacus TaxID=106335 RepID=A0A6A2X5W0_HIBSY|nr:ERF017 protein [Hibiscus syriacus]
MRHVGIVKRFSDAKRYVKRSPNNNLQPGIKKQKKTSPLGTLIQGGGDRNNGETRKRRACHRENRIEVQGRSQAEMGKWVSEIRLPQQGKDLVGSYKSAEKAARAFDAALFCLRGHSAKFNFPDNPPDIVGGRSLTWAQIQAAARSLNQTFDIGGIQHSNGSSSPSVSDGTTQFDTQLPMEETFLDL